MLDAKEYGLWLAAEWLREGRCRRLLRRGRPRCLATGSAVARNTWWGAAGDGARSSASSHGAGQEVGAVWLRVVS
jgi:hypothetical protein